MCSQTPKTEMGEANGLPSFALSYGRFSWMLSTDEDSYGAVCPITTLAKGEARRPTVVYIRRDMQHGSGHKSGLGYRETSTTYRGWGPKTALQLAPKKTSASANNQILVSQGLYHTCMVLHEACLDLPDLARQPGVNAMSWRCLRMRVSSCRERWSGAKGRIRTGVQNAKPKPSWGTLGLLVLLLEVPWHGIAHG